MSKNLFLVFENMAKRKRTARKNQSKEKEKFKIMDVL